MLSSMIIELRTLQTVPTLERKIKVRHIQKEIKQREEVQEDETEGDYHNQLNSVTCFY